MTAAITRPGVARTCGGIVENFFRNRAPGTSQRSGNILTREEAREGKHKNISIRGRRVVEDTGMRECASAKGFPRTGGSPGDRGPCISPPALAPAANPSRALAEAAINTAKYLKKCKYQDKAEVLSKCLGDAMEDALRTLKNGEPALGIQPLDPLRVSKLDILQGGNRPVSLSIHHRNLDVYGVSQCKVTHNEFDKVDGTMRGRMFCPNLKLQGDYELDGRVLLLPVRGNGKSTITLEGNDCAFTAHGKHDNRNGTLYEKYYKIDFTFVPKKMTMNFENLFDGDRTLGRTMNEFINENWKEILNELKPSYEEVFSTVFMDTVERVFSRIPVKNILPDYYDNPKP